MSSGKNQKITYDLKNCIFMGGSRSQRLIHVINSSTLSNTHGPREWTGSLHSQTEETPNYRHFVRDAH